MNPNSLISLGSSKYEWGYSKTNTELVTAVKDLVLDQESDTERAQHNFTRQESDTKVLGSLDTVTIQFALSISKRSMLVVVCMHTSRPSESAVRDLVSDRN